MPEWLQVLLLATVTALTTGLGVLPLIFIDDFSKRFLAHGSAVAAGLMTGASFMLVNEGISYSSTKTLVGLVIGLAAIALGHRWLQKEEFDVGELEGADALKALVLLGVMTMHSFAEGVSVGVAFGGGESFGIFIAIAIAVHNIPEGIAIGVGLVPEGMKWWKAALWAVFSSLPQPLMAVPAYFFVEAFRPGLPVGMGLAAGAMLWMVVSELIPDAMEHESHSAVATTTVLSFTAMMAFQLWIGA